jgi:hypothetical protein
VWGEAPQQRQLALEDRTGADDEGTLVDSAEPTGVSASQDRCCPGNASIKA